MHTLHIPHIVASLFHREGTEKILHLLDPLGKKARIVGGAVRDAWVKKPITDIDIATSLLPEESMALLLSHGHKVVPTGLKHGTITTFFKGNAFEITTLRRDIECDGRRALVAFTDDWRLDAARRDFTINALSCAVDGTLYDYCSGIEDLQQGIVRFVGNPLKRIEEDYLRILRFFRFSAYYGTGELEREALEGCAYHAASLATLSGERIQGEMLKILLAPTCASILPLMQQRHILQVVLPASVDFHALAHLVNLEKETNAKPDAIRRLACLLRTIKETDRAHVLSAIAYQWKLSTHQRKMVEALAMPALTISLPLSIAEQKKAIRKLGASLFYALLLLYAAEKQSNGSTGLGMALRPMLDLCKSWQPPPFPVSGQDLINQGYTKGKALGAMLQRLETRWEQGEYMASREELLHYSAAFTKGF